MIDFNDVHARFWRDHRNDPDCAIPIRGGYAVEREGRTYAVLFTHEGATAAIYRIAGDARPTLRRVIGEEAEAVDELARAERNQR